MISKRRFIGLTIRVILLITVFGIPLICLIIADFLSGILIRIVEYSWKKANLIAERVNGKLIAWEKDTPENTMERLKEDYTNDK